VFGVTNDRQVMGIDNPELPRDFGNKLTHGLNPSVPFRFSAPMTVSGAASIWVCEVPRSLRGPHAVLINDHWLFPRRTESGSNVSMNVEEIRASFLDSGRRLNELAWLRAEIDRIRDVAERVNREGKGASDLDLVLTKFDVSRIQPLLGTVFSLVNQNPALVKAIHALIERCERVDGVLAPMVAFAVLPRDRSFSGTRHDWRRFLLENVPQISIESRNVVGSLDALK
jgi:hypothetical protein